MKYTFFAFLLFTLMRFGYGQTDGITYQAVIIDNNPQEIPGVDVPSNNLPNVALQVRFTIIDDMSSSEYQEIHQTETDAYGMINLVIGSGLPNIGAFDKIYWNDAKFLKVEIDLNDGNGMVEFSYQKLMYLPYVKHREIIATSTLDVDGETNLNNSFTVNNGSPTLLSGDLTVEGQVNFQGHLEVGGDTHLYSDLDVDGITNLNSDLFVNNGSDTNLSGDLNVEGQLGVKGDTYLYSDLDVDGITNLNSDLFVNNGSDTNLSGDLNVEGQLGVKGDTHLYSDLDVDGETNLNNSLTVNNGSPTLLSGNLTVKGKVSFEDELAIGGVTILNSDLGVLGVSTLNNTLNVNGSSNLNNSLTVTNGSPTLLSGDLTVEGEVEVRGDTHLYSDLDVDGITNLNSDLFVNNGSSTTLSGDLTVQGTSTFQDANFQNIDVDGQSNLNGQVNINATVTGGQGNYKAYPLGIEGSSLGIAIKLNAVTPNNSNNFITFFDKGGQALGRIEGETKAEVKNSSDYKYELAMLTADEVLAAANMGSAAIPITVGGVGVSVGPCGACIAMAVADLALATANLTNFARQAISDLGVTYQSGSADYAEWLERSNALEKIEAGDIVGVTGGKVSKNTINSQQYMVISTKPAILGNMPMHGNEGLYEKVAFMGQIPVKVRGIVLQGDYILPSGLNDGTGIGVSPQKIKAEQYREIVGVAWSEVLIDTGISMVNMAIGLKGNDLANLAAEHERKIKVLEDKFKTFEQRLLELEYGSVIAISEEAADAKENKIPQKELTRSQLMASNMPLELSDEIMEEAMFYLENKFKEKGVDIENHSGLNKLFNDSKYRAEIMAKTKANYKIYYNRLLEKN